MIKKWLITNQIDMDLDFVIKTDNWNFYYDKIDALQVGKKSNVKILIDGYILPRNFCYEEYKKFSSYKLIDKLFTIYGEDFISYIKGNFTIVIISDDKYFVFNDHHSIQKFYYYIDEGSFIITNDYRQFFKVKDIKENLLAPAIFALFQHLIGGYTYYKNVFYSSPATKIKYDDRIIVDNYWNRKTLLSQNSKNYSLKEICSNFKLNIENIIDYFNLNKIHLTQTGGRDTRTILATLLSLNIKPNLFTFGDPRNRDIIVSKNIAEHFNLEFNNPNIYDINEDKYNQIAQEISKIGNPLLNLHRVHRLDAIKNQKRKYDEIDIVFMGAMGGDYIKGVHFNDYIVSEFIRKYVFNEYSNITELIAEILDKHYIKYDDKMIKELISLITNLEFLNGNNFKETEFLIAFDLIGSQHDVQDINIFQEEVEIVSCPFMDIDFLERLFSSNYSLLHNNRSSRNIFKRLDGGDIQAYIIKTLSPQLASIPFANGYTLHDLKLNKFIYLAKRVYLKYFVIKSISSFSYGGWFKKYISKNIDNSVIKDFYDIENYDIELKNNNHESNEGYWHKFSNPINIQNYFEKLGDNK